MGVVVFYVDVVVLFYVVLVVYVVLTLVSGVSETAGVVQVVTRVRIRSLVAGTVFLHFFGWVLSFGLLFLYFLDLDDLLQTLNQTLLSLSLGFVVILLEVAAVLLVRLGDVLGADVTFLGGGGERTVQNVGLVGIVLFRRG